MTLSLGEVRELTYLQDGALIKLVTQIDEALETARDAPFAEVELSDISRSVLARVILLYHDATHRTQVVTRSGVRYLRVSRAAARV